MKLLVDIEQLDHEAISWWKKKTPAMRGVLMQAVYELESSVPAPRRCAGRVVGPHGVNAAAGQRRLFPKPILEAIELLRDRTIDRWLEWQPDKNWPTKMALTLMTSGERKPSARRLWGTWQRHEAAGMEWALKQVGMQVFGGRDWELDWHDGEKFAVWYLPTEAMPDEEMPDTTTVDTGRSLMSVFAS